MPEILNRTTDVVGRWPITTCPSCPGGIEVPSAWWATPPTVSPHGGNGASLANEDGIVLAECVRDALSPAQAFESFE